MSMKTLLVALLFTVAGMAGEPSELTVARDRYKDAVEAALAPVKASYRAKLTALMKGFGAQGKIDEAARVKAELDALADVSVVVSPIVGKWKWGNGKIFNVSGDGTVVAGPDSATWAERDGKVMIRWGNGRIDSITVKGDKVHIVNDLGERFTAERVKD